MLEHPVHRQKTATDRRNLTSNLPVNREAGAGPAVHIHHPQDGEAYRQDGHGHQQPEQRRRTTRLAPAHQEFALQRGDSIIQLGNEPEQILDNFFLY